MDGLTDHDFDVPDTAPPGPVTTAVRSPDGSTVLVRPSVKSEKL
jgi:hypothetical protein